MVNSLPNWPEVTAAGVSADSGGVRAGAGIVVVLGQDGGLRRGGARDGQAKRARPRAQQRDSGSVGAGETWCMLLPNFGAAALARFARVLLLPKGHFCRIRRMLVTGHCRAGTGIISCRFPLERDTTIARPLSPITYFRRNPGRTFPLGFRDRPLRVSHRLRRHHRQLDRPDRADDLQLHQGLHARHPALAGASTWTPHIQAAIRKTPDVDRTIETSGFFFNVNTVFGPVPFVCFSVTDRAARLPAASGRRLAGRGADARAGRRRRPSSRRAWRTTRS